MDFPSDNESDGGWESLAAQVGPQDQQPPLAPCDEIRSPSGGDDCSEPGWGSVANDEISGNQADSPSGPSGLRIPLLHQIPASSSRKRGRPFGPIGSHEYRRSLKEAASSIPSQKMSPAESLALARRAKAQKAEENRAPQE